MADVQRTYSLVAIGFITALLAGVTVWPPIVAAILSSVGWAGILLVAALTFIPLFAVMMRPSLITYLLFSIITEGYVLSVVPAYAQALGPIAWGVVAGGAAAFAVIGVVFSERDVDESVGTIASGMIILALAGSLILLIGGFFGFYSWHLDLFTTGVAFVAFLLFAAHDASRVRQRPDEYSAAAGLLIDLVGVIIELLRLVWLLFQREE